MRVAILCTGDELTRGELGDTNGRWLAEATTARGHEVQEILCIGDESAALEHALRRLAEHHDVILCCGGLGPTTDDITRATVADMLDVALVRDPAQFEAIRRKVEAIGRVLTESNSRQADLPEGAQLLANSEGTAPGFCVSLGSCKAYFMPGVPREMRVMFTTHVAPKLAAHGDPTTSQIVLRVYGMPESLVCDALAGIESTYGVRLGYRAHLPELDVKVLARAETAEVAVAKAQAAADEVRRRLGADIIFGEGSQQLPGVVCDLLADHGLRLGLAESCTGGLVASLLTQHPGASRVLAGGVVAYSNAAKQRLLDVPAEQIARWGAVSEPVARSMAEGARRVFDADVGLSLTGIAGPTGGSPEKPVGLVVFSVATATGTTVAQQRFAGTRTEVQRRAAFEGFSMVRRAAHRVLLPSLADGDGDAK